MSNDVRKINKQHLQNLLILCENKNGLHEINKIILHFYDIEISVPTIKHL